MRQDTRSQALGPVAALLLGAALAALAALAVLGDRSTPETAAPSSDELTVERTELTPGAIELTVRNTGSDPVRIAQVFVNDVYVDLAGAGEPLDPMSTDTVRLDFPWQDGQPYLVSMLTSTGAVVEHEIDEAGDDPGADTGAAFGEAALVVLGAAMAFLLLAGVDRGLRRRQRTGVHHSPTAFRLALVSAVGVGLHNLGAGLAIGAAYAVGAVAVGAALVIGVALHNATEGIAVAGPLAHHRPAPPRLLALALVAGAPGIAGAVLGAAVENTGLATFLLGIGVGTIVHVISRLVPRLREPGRAREGTAADDAR